MVTTKAYSSFHQTQCSSRSLPHGPMSRQGQSKTHMIIPLALATATCYVQNNLLATATCYVQNNPRSLATATCYAKNNTRSLATITCYVQNNLLATATCYAQNNLLATVTCYAQNNPRSLATATCYAPEQPPVTAWLRPIATSRTTPGH